MEQKPMTMNEYQFLAMRTAEVYTQPDHMLLNALMGLAGEAGEAIDLLKKVMFHGHPMSHEVYVKLIKELGDALWYIQLGASALQVPLEYIAETNIRKLMERYPDRFTPEASMARVDEKQEVQNGEESYKQNETTGDNPTSTEPDSASNGQAGREGSGKVRKNNRRGRKR